MPHITVTGACTVYSIQAVMLVVGLGLGLAGQVLVNITVYKTLVRA